MGVAPIGRFEPQPPFFDAPPEGHYPHNFLPSAKSVISIAMPILKPVMDASAILANRDLEMIPEEVKYPYFDSLHNQVGHVVHDLTLEYIGQMGARFFTRKGFKQ